MRTTNTAKIATVASQPQNVSVLNGKRAGKIHLFSSQPPVWQSQLTAPLTKDQMEINDISTAAQQFTNACDIATSDRPGCVHLSIDMEVQVQDLLTKLFKYLLILHML